MPKITSKEKCISVFQIQIWYAFSNKYHFDYNQSSILFDENNIWNYIIDSYESIESDPLSIIVRNIKKIIDNGGYINEREA